MRLPISILCLMASANAFALPDFPQYRGPQRDGHIVGTLLPKQLPDKAPAPIWKVEIGDGYSSPVVSEGRVFIMGRPKEGEESCLCFDALTGKPIWKVVYPCSFVPPDPTAGKGPGSTPTVDKDRVYMLGLGGMFHCLDVKTGSILWKHDFMKEYWGVKKDPEFSDAWMPVCGSCSSALVNGHEVIISVGGEKAGSVVAFDRTTGKIIWKALKDRGSYASPMPAEIGGVKQFVAFTGTRMVGLDKLDHTLLWEFPVTALFEQTICSPVVWRDRVIVSGDGKPTIALQFTKESDRLEHTEAWKNAELCSYLVTPVIVKDHLIGVDYRSKRVVSLDLETGKTDWTSPDRMPMMASILVAGDRILVLGNNGELSSFETNFKKCVPTGKCKVSEAGGTWSHLAIVGSKIYAKDKQNLICLDLTATKS